MTTWRQVRNDIREWAVDDFLDGHYDEDSVEEWAHETADGCEYVIYYHHQNLLWLESEYVQSFEDMVFGVDNIQQRIQACVYYAIYETALADGQEAIEDHGVLHTARGVRTFLSSTGHHIAIPVLDTVLAAPTR